MSKNPTQKNPSQTTRDQYESATSMYASNPSESETSYVAEDNGSDLKGNLEQSYVLDADSKSVNGQDDSEKPSETSQIENPQSMNVTSNSTSESPNKSDARPQERARTKKFSKASKVDEVDHTEDSSSIDESAAGVEMQAKIPDRWPNAPLVKEVPSFLGSSPFLYKMKFSNPDWRWHSELSWFNKRATVMKTGTTKHYLQCQGIFRCATLAAGANVALFYRLRQTQKTDKNGLKARLAVNVAALTKEDFHCDVKLSKEICEDSGYVLLTQNGIHEHPAPALEKAASHQKCS